MDLPSRFFNILNKSLLRILLAASLDSVPLRTRHSTTLPRISIALQVNEIDPIA